MSGATKVMPDGDGVFDIEGQATVVQGPYGALKEVRSSDVKRFRLWCDLTVTGTWVLEFVTNNGASMTVCLQAAKPDIPRPAMFVWIQSQQDSTAKRRAAGDTT